MMLFFKEFLRFPAMVGAIAASSSKLAEAMLAQVDFQKELTIVEYGPGLGSFSRLISERLHSTSRYLGIEINPHFFEKLVRTFPSFSFVNSDVQETPAILSDSTIPLPVNAVISGLPWTLFSREKQDLILEGICEILAVDGTFATFAYLQGTILPSGIYFRKILKNKFRSVTYSKIIWNNIPPAIVYYCKYPQKHK